MRARGPGGDPQHLLFSNGKKFMLCHCFVSICQHFKIYYMETIVLLKCIWKCQQLWHWLLKHWITQYITSIGQASWFQLMSSHKVVINFGTRDWLCGCSHDEPSRNRGLHSVAVLVPCGFSKQQTTSAFKGTWRRHADFSGDFSLDRSVIGTHT